MALVDEFQRLAEDKIPREMMEAIRIRESPLSPMVVIDPSQLTPKQHIFLTSDSHDYAQLWIFERDVQTTGGDIKFNQPFFIRNVKSGLFLGEFGLMEDTPKQLFYVLKPDSMPAGAVVPLGFELVIGAWKSERTNMRKTKNADEIITVLSPEEQSGESVCMPLIIPNEYQSSTGEYRVREIQANLMPLSSSSQAPLFQLLPGTSEIPFLQKLAQILPQCCQVRGHLASWVKSNAGLSATEVAPSVFVLEEEMSNFVKMLSIIEDTIKSSKNPEDFELKQNAVVGVELHLELLNIAETVYTVTAGTDDNSQLFAQATAAAFTKIWQTLIQVASDNYFTCAALETEKSRICAMLSREKTLIGRLLTEIYGMVDPDMPQYDEEFAAWCRRLETLSAENIEEQTVFINLIHCLCEVGESVKIEYLKEVVGRLFDQKTGFRILKLEVKDNTYGTVLFPRCGEPLEELVAGNPSLTPDPDLLKEGILWVSFESLRDDYTNYVCTALTLMNTLSKGDWKEGRQLVQEASNITPELILSMAKCEKLHLKVRQACLSLCETLVADDEQSAFCGLKDADDTCFLSSEISAESNEDFLERQMTLQSSAMADCVKLTLQVLLKHDLPSHIERYPLRDKIEYIQATLSLTNTMLEKGHLSLKNIKRLSQVLGYFLVGMGGKAEGKHWATRLFASTKKQGAGDKAEAGFKLDLTELLQVLTMMYKIKGFFAREKVKKLLEKSNKKVLSEDDVSQLLTDFDRSVLTASVSGMATRRGSYLSERLLSFDQPHAVTNKTAEANENLLRLLLSLGVVPPALKDRLILLLKLMFDEKTYIFQMLKQAEVLYDQKLIEKYEALRSRVNSIDWEVTLATVRAEVLSSHTTPTIDELYQWIAETTDAISLRCGATSLTTIQNIIRSVGLHKKLLMLLDSLTEFPTALVRVHPKLLRLQIAISSFLFYFTRQNPTNREAVLPLLQKHHFFSLVPRYFDFINEVGQFEYMNQVEIARLCQFVLSESVNHRLNSLHLLRVMMFDRIGRPVQGRQNTIARYIIEASAEAHIKKITSISHTARLIELLALSAIDNETTSMLCRSLLPLGAVKALADKKEPALHHALLSFLYYVHIRPSFSQPAMQRFVQEIYSMLEKSVDTLAPLFANKVDLVALGKSGKYEHIFPKSRPSLVEEGTTLNQSDAGASLLRLLSSGNAWETKGGLLHIFPSFLRHLPMNAKAKVLCRKLAANVLSVQMTLRELQSGHSDIDFSILIRYTQDCLFLLGESFSIFNSQDAKRLLGPVKDTFMCTMQDLDDSTEEGRFHMRMMDFLKVYNVAVGGAGDTKYLRDMVNVFVSFVFGEGGISKKVSKEKLEAMCKTLVRVQRLFANTRHRELYFNFLRELIPAYTSPETLLQKYTLTPVFVESEVVMEAIDSLISSGSQGEVYAACGFLNRLLELQQKDFVDEFLQLIDESEKSYRVFLHVKAELHTVKDEMWIQTKSNQLQLDEDRTALERRIQVLKEALTFLQACCDNCHLDFQNYMREQRKREGQADVDLLSEIAQFIIDVRDLGLQLVERKSYGELVAKALATVTDFITGPCEKSQKSLGGNLQFFIAVDELVQLSQSDLRNSVANSIHENGILVLLALLEGTPEDSIFTNMVSLLNISQLKKALERFYDRYIRGQTDKFELELTNPDDPLEAIVKKKLEVYMLQAILLIKLKARTDASELRSFAHSTVDPQSAYSFFSSYIGYVEIAQRDGEIEHCFFPIPFECKFLTPASRRFVILSIDRTSHQKKIEEFVSWAPFAHREMVHQQLLSVSKLLKFVSSRWKLYAQLSFFVVLLINLILLFSIRESLEFTEANDSAAMLGIKVCGVVQILLYIACVMFVILEYYPAYFQPSDGITSVEFSHYPLVPFNESSFTKLLFGRIRQGSIKPTTMQLSFREVGNSLGLYYHYVYFLISIMAIHDPMLYPILLLDLIKQNEELVNVLRSVTLNLRQLMLTLALGVIAIFLFGAYSFTFLQSDFHEEDAMRCDSLWYCFSTTLYYGTRSDGGIGDALATPASDHSFERIVFDMTFFLVIIILFLNIIFGIIIDTFAELRDVRREVLDDIHNVCFICGSHRSDIDRRGSGWSRHFMCEHIPLSYLAFLIYVKQKSLSDCSGIEKSVLERLSKNDMSFLPTTFTQVSRKSKHPS